MKELVKKNFFGISITGFLLTGIIVLAFILRIWMIGSVPVSLSGDDADIGYHAYSIFKTGKDYTGHFLPFHLNSMADKKSSLYTYTLVPFVAVLGISEVSLRLPSVIFGIFGVLGIYLLVNLMTKNVIVALLSAFFIAISPWHIQYSRWSFEGIQMLTLYIFGIYFLLKSFKNGYLIIFATLFLSLTPISYHAAKAFLPITIIFILIIWYKNIFKIDHKYLFISIILAVLILAPFGYDTLYRGGTDRFTNTSLFARPTLGGEIGLDRLRDSSILKSEDNSLLQKEMIGKIYHNKLTIFFDNLTDNYLKSFSTEFLFIKGDTNPRHSIQTIGGFYKYQAFFLILGVIFLVLDKNIGNRIKVFILGWLLLAPLPSIVTLDGGNHASRLLFLIPPLIFLISYGVYKMSLFLKSNIKVLYWNFLFVIILLFLIGYLHSYYFHYSWDFERWWHGGYKNAIRYSVKESKNYEKVIISSADEPSKIFFLAYSQYPPAKFHKEKDQKLTDQDYGEVYKLDNYYFPEVGKKISIYELEKIIKPNTLYMSPYREFNLNLIEEPLRIPRGLELVNTIFYESGEPAFYFLRKN